MKPLPNYNFSSLTTFPDTLVEIENNLLLLIQFVGECGETFTDADRTQLIANIEWLKRYYEQAERILLS